MLCQMLSRSAQAMWHGPWFPPPPTKTWVWLKVVEQRNASMVPTRAPRRPPGAGLSHRRVFLAGATGSVCGRVFKLKMLGPLLWYLSSTLATSVAVVAAPACFDDGLLVG